jgi:hypothetical protein
MNKLSLVGMQPRVKYKENFDVLSEGPSSGVLHWKRRNSPYIFQEVASLPTKACSYYCHYTGTYTVQNYITKWSITYSFKPTWNCLQVFPVGKPVWWWAPSGSCWIKSRQQNSHIYWGDQYNLCWEKFHNINVSVQRFILHSKALYRQVIFPWKLLFTRV